MLLLRIECTSVFVVEEIAPKCTMILISFLNFFKISRPFGSTSIGFVY